MPDFKLVLCIPQVTDEQSGSGELEKGKVLFGSQKGTSKKFAQQLATDFALKGIELEVVDLGSYEVEQLWKESLVIFVLSTYENGTPPEGAKWFCEWLSDSAMDFRVGNEALSKAQFAVFGCGNSLYDDNYNKVPSTAPTAECADTGKWLQQLFISGVFKNLHRSNYFAGWQWSVQGTRLLTL